MVITSSFKKSSLIAILCGAVLGMLWVVSSKETLYLIPSPPTLAPKTDAKVSPKDKPKAVKWKQSEETPYLIPSTLAYKIEAKVSPKDKPKAVKWKKTTFRKAINRFEPRFADTCYESSTPTICIDPPEPSGSVVKSRCGPISFEDLYREMRVLRIPVSLMEDNEYIYNWEKDLLSQPQLNDMKNLPDQKLSSVVAIEPKAKQGKVNCNIGQTIKFRVDLKDGYGRFRTSGGDDVRAWTMQGRLMTRGSFTATAQVHDLSNGSYIVSTKCLWPGKTQLKVGVAYPTEFLRLAAQQSRINHGLLTAGLYSKPGSNIVDATVCAATPNLPWSCLCNYTSWNDATFYCGRPSYAGLNCSHIKSFRHMHSHGPMDVTAQERYMSTRMARPADQTLISHTIIIDASTKGSLPKLPACSKKHYSQTWTATSPRGYWNWPTWNSLVCKEQIDKNAIQACLRGVSIWKLGDSNGLRLYESMKGLINPCTESQHLKGFLRHCQNRGTGASLNYQRHEYPVMLKNMDKLVEKSKPVSQVLESLPSKGLHIVITHYYVHLSVSHVSVMESRIRKLAKSYQRLLDRNPDVVLAIRGPHVSYVEWAKNHYGGGDCLISKVLPLVKEVFEPYKDRVIYLDGWEMTVGIQNQNLHPPGNVPLAMAKSVVAFACGNKALKGRNNI